eukprot:TRINITY_DN2463_c0_g2_i3.p1 TRINITY_DN2463_c0_g2~~TRINITY_DN2463_c0_g2_i3.p1  ORF type:complete len:285 (-),score=55.00 TRINITY_DN2463_c0_g2_i3:184-1038(-)
MSKLSTAQLRHIPSGKLHVSRPTHWLTSRFHFSFADYYNPKNTNFGVLRVLNDDLVTARNGFGAHPHSNMEIISYIVTGYLSHADSQGNKESLGRGGVQYMSAGTGIVHSEMNEDKKETVRFLQLWIVPNQRGHKPAYGSKYFEESERLNKVLRIVKGYTPATKPSTFPSPKNGQKEDIIIHQDASIYVSEIEPGRHVDFEFQPKRQAYMICIEGTLNLRSNSAGEAPGEDLVLSERDAVEIRFTSSLIIENPHTSTKRSHFLMVEMAETSPLVDAFGDDDDEY